MARKIITVDDLQYFRAVDAQVRNHMKRFEAGLLHVAREAVRDAQFENLLDFPIEGYYHETPQLTEFFTLIRNLQEQASEEITPAIMKLHRIYTHNAFGIGQGRPNAISDKEGTNVLYPDEPASTVSPVVDPVTVASMALMPENSAQPPQWSIVNIMDKIKGVDLEECLVGLALTVDQSMDYRNPLATTMACETTVLSRMKAVSRGIGPAAPDVDWQVSADAEKYGAEVIRRYNDLFAQHSDRHIEADLVTPRNAGRIIDDAPPLERCVNINSDLRTGRPRHYHWAIEHNGSRHAVKEFWNPEVVTTKDWQSGRHFVAYDARAQSWGSFTAAEPKNTHPITGEALPPGVGVISSRKRQPVKTDALTELKPSIKLLGFHLAEDYKYPDAIGLGFPSVPPIVYSAEGGVFDKIEEISPNRVLIKLDNGETGIVDIDPAKGTLHLTETTADGKKTEWDAAYEPHCATWAKRQQDVLGLITDDLEMENVFLRYESEKKRVTMVDSHDNPIWSQEVIVPRGMTLENIPEELSDFCGTSFLKLSGPEFNHSEDISGKKCDYMIISISPSGLKQKRYGETAGIGFNHYTSSGVISGHFPTLQGLINSYYTGEGDTTFQKYIMRLTDRIENLDVKMGIAATERREAEARGDEEAVHKKWEEFIFAFEEQSSVYRFRADARFADGDNVGAVRDCTSSIHKEPQERDADAYALRAMACATVGMIDDAAKDMEMAHKLAPEGAMTFAASGYLHERAGEKTEAAMDYLRAKGINPECRHALKGLERVK